MSIWLGYGSERVPTLYQDVKAGKVSEFKSKDLRITAVLSGSSVGKSVFQQPLLRLQEKEARGGDSQRSLILAPHNS